MFGCWRRTDAADPETFVAAVAAVLSDYPAEVVLRVTDPRTGLPGSHAFPPNVYEVKQACEVEVAPLRRQRERERRSTDSSRLLAPPPEEKPTPEQVQAILRSRGFGPVAVDTEGERIAADRRAKELYRECQATTSYPVLSDKLASTIADIRERALIADRMAKREDAA